MPFRQLQRHLWNQEFSLGQEHASPVSSRKKGTETRVARSGEAGSRVEFRKQVEVRTEWGGTPRESEVRGATGLAQGHRFWPKVTDPG